MVFVFFLQMYRRELQVRPTFSLLREAVGGGKKPLVSEFLQVFGTSRYFATLQSISQMLFTYDKIQTPSLMVSKREATSVLYFFRNPKACICTEIEDCLEIPSEIDQIIISSSLPGTFFLTSRSFENGSSQKDKPKCQD